MSAMSQGTSPSVSRLAGQLRYLFDERPELRAASPGKLRAVLSMEDRSARALARHPLAGREEIARRSLELDDRIALDAVRTARDMVLGDLDDSRSGFDVAQ